MRRMLDRIALYQTRLRTPGITLDAKGIALGSRGLVLVPTIDRLVAWLSIYTRERSLEELLPSLRIEALRSRVGTRELALSFAAESSDRMDRMAESARLVGGFVFTGTSRHFVQYRDAASPFGYDPRELVPTDAPLALYHQKFTQFFEIERSFELRALLLRLRPHVDPSTAKESGPRIVLAEQGLGPALIHYFVRSQVDGELTVFEWPPESAFDDAPVRRYAFRIPELPARMLPLLTKTPGITVFAPAGPGVAVESGYRHPVTLRACPLFDPNGLVLFRGGEAEPWVIERVPQMGPLRAFARVELHPSDLAEPPSPSPELPEVVRVPLRVVPSLAPIRNVTASVLSLSELPLLRQLAYALPRSTIVETRIALTPRGAFLISKAGIEAIPLGTFFTAVHPSIFVPAGHEVSPAVSPEVLYRAVDPPPAHLLFIDAEARALAVDEGAFVPLETALVEASPWEPVVAEAVVSALEVEPIDLRIEPLSTFAMSGVAPPPEKELGAEREPSGPRDEV